MEKKKNTRATVEAPASGGQLESSGLSPEARIARLKTLNGLLLNKTVENREQNNQLRSKLDSLAADHDILDTTERDVFRIVLSSSLYNAAARSTVEMAAASETVEKMLKEAESATTELNAAKMRLLLVTREKDGVDRHLERIVKERDLSQSDLEEKRKELVNLEESFQSLERALLKEREVADGKCRELEEELQSVRHDKDLLKRCRDEAKNLAEKLVREMEAMRSQKHVDMDMLKAENKENASKISALEEECRHLKEIRGQLQNEVCSIEASLKELKKEKVELVASYAEINKRCVKFEEDLKRCLTEFGRLENEKLDSEKTFDLKQTELTIQINDMKGNMTKMAAEKNTVDQRSANYEIQIGKLQAEISELQSARKSLEAAHRSCSQKIAIKGTYYAAMQRENHLKDKETVALRIQLDESMKAKRIVELKFEQLQKELNYLTTENEETEKLLETSKLEFKDIEKKLKTLEDASGQVFALSKNIAAEVMDEKRTQQNYTIRETGLEVEKDEEVKMFVENLEAIKLAVKGKDAKIKDLNQELELLQLSVAYAENKGAIWKWFFPATTTIFAAVSLAYAARAR